jgi:hypothetical protein
MNLKDLPLLHTHLPEHAGTFCGIVGGTAEQPFAALILLDVKPDQALNFADACAWGQSLGGGCHVPTRDESAHLYATSRQLLNQDSWHWTSTKYDPPHSDSHAWMQHFYDGNRSITTQSSKRLCRAVR